MTIKMTTNKLNISAFIITLNEAGRVAATLKSLDGLVDEIIVVDSGSTDGTQNIAAEHGAKVIHNDWPGYGPQKRFAEERCAHDWVLNLDADEVLSEALIQEIRESWPQGASGEVSGRASEAKNNPQGYVFNIRDCVPGEASPRAFAHTTPAVRLYDKTKGRYADSMVHDRVHFADPDARIHQLKSPVYHYSVISMEQAVAKLNRYSTMQAEDMQERGRFPKRLGLRLWVEFPLTFLKSYLLRGDILRGRKGFTNAMTHAFGRFARIAKAIEHRRK